GVSAVEIQGEAANGISTGQAMDEMTRLVEENAPGYSIAWNGVSFQERQASSNSVALYSISLLFVFLCLAALYESWSIPFAVMLVVPLGIVGAVGAAYLTQLCPWLIPWSKPLENDVYFQVGLLTTIGLSAKNAILIVEFAKELYDKGHRLSESVIEASRIRLRPILMTSFAFILGVLPLAISTGAGAAGRNEIGICVIGGMLSATVLAVFFVPIFFILVMRYFTKYKPKNAKTETLEVQS
ncbi:efflux RND transporter permease subunit, partial [Ruminobacter sp.]|uniref:efflux RND transporter permease subunit n=1 Tax=Ruminobacter sp. TaxID=2774296 RepID=UPI0038639BEC